MREELLRKIREACIVAKPSLKESSLVEVKDSNLEFTYENIVGLADVLCAYQDAFTLKGDLPIQMQAQMAREGFADIATRWNIHKDDLEKQEDSTLQFLAQLLTK
jgi:hypothetical protein